MPTIHERIEELLAAAVHDELSDAERHALHVHLVECAECRQLHKEEQLMNKALNDVLADEKPDFGFEKRLLYAFRQRVPHREGFGVVFMNLMRSRATQLVGAAALLLALVQLGRMLTGDDVAGPALRSSAARLAPASAVNLPRREDESRQAQDQRANQSQQFAEVDVGAAKKSSVLEAPAVASLAQPAAAAQADDASFAEDKADASIAEKLPAKAAALSKEVAQAPAPPPPPAPSSRKLIRNARVDLEVRSFEETVQKIAGLANENRGHIATTSSVKQANGKLRGEIIVKVLPDTLDRFLESLRGLGELKNQTLGTEDVAKAYFDIESRLKNAQAMEQRLIDLLKKKSDDINDLLAVEKELGRVREQIEHMQGELKFMDSQVQFATVTIALVEKDMDVPAAFLLKERAQLSLFAPDVEKTYNEIKTLAAPKVQITHAQLDRDNAGRVSARVSMLIAPEESEAVIGRVKGMARVDNFQVQTERVARGGQGMSEEAKTERDKVELNVTIAREEEEIAMQQTSLSIRTKDVNETSKQLRDLVEKQSGRVRGSSFSRDPNGREYADVSLRVPMKNYPALMQLLAALGRVENVSVHRQERPDAKIDEANAPADLSIQVYSPGNIVSEETGVVATLRRTLGQGAAALMWSVQMIGVALAFLVPWVLPVVLLLWIGRRIMRARAARRSHEL